MEKKSTTKTKTKKEPAVIEYFTDEMHKTIFLFPDPPSRAMERSGKPLRTYRLGTLRKK
jgi:hypothetical protein